MQYLICGLALKPKQKSERQQCVFAQFAAQPEKSGTAQIPLGRCFPKNPTSGLPTPISKIHQGLS